MEDNQVQIGGKIRRLRRQRHISQAALASQLGISASYLNLIEHNRRNVTVQLLFAIAGHFGIEPGELAQSDDARLLGDLTEIFGDDVFADTDLTNQDIRDFAASSPAVARAVTHLFDRFRHAKQSDVTQNPATTDTNHLAPDLATDAISDFLQENANHFPTLEEAAERIRIDIDNAAETFEAGMRTWLENTFGLTWRVASLPHGIARRIASNGRTIEVADTLPSESALFTIAHHIGHLAAEREIQAILDQSTLPEGDAETLAKNVLASYFAAALIMPYAPFLKACRDTRYDIDRVARRFGTSFEQACHRMTTLQRPGALGVPLHLVRTDIAGNISKRFSLSGIHIPRHAGACPRWNVYSAFLQPGRTNIQLSQMPNGDSFFCIAKSFEKGGFRHNASLRHFAIGLGCDIAHAKQLVYSDGIDLNNQSLLVPIGPSCRVCPRMECEQRAHPAAGHRFRAEPDVKHETIYGNME